MIQVGDIVYFWRDDSILGGTVNGRIIASDSEGPMDQASVDCGMLGEYMVSVSELATDPSKVKVPLLNTTSAGGTDQVQEICRLLGLESSAEDPTDV